MYLDILWTLPSVTEIFSILGVTDRYSYLHFHYFVSQSSYFLCQPSPLLQCFSILFGHFLFFVICDDETFQHSSSLFYLFFSSLALIKYEYLHSLLFLYWFSVFPLGSGIYLRVSYQHCVLPSLMQSSCPFSSTSKISLEFLVSLSVKWTYALSVLQNSVVRQSKYKTALQFCVSVAAFHSK